MINSLKLAICALCLAPMLVVPRASANPVTPDSIPIPSPIPNSIAPTALDSVLLAGQQQVGPEQEPPATEPPTGEATSEPQSTPTSLPTRLPNATSDPTQQPAQDTPTAAPDPAQNPTSTTVPPVSTVLPTAVPAQASATSASPDIEKGIANEERPIIVVEAFDTGGLLTGGRPEFSPADPYTQSW